MGNWDVDSQRDRVVAFAKCVGSCDSTCRYRLLLIKTEVQSTAMKWIHGPVGEWCWGHHWLLSSGTEEKTSVTTQAYWGFYSRGQEPSSMTSSNGTSSLPQVCWGVFLSLISSISTSNFTDKPVNAFSRQQILKQHTLLSWQRGVRMQRMNESFRNKKMHMGKLSWSLNGKGFQIRASSLRESRMVGESKRQFSPFSLQNWKL